MYRKGTTDALLNKCGKDGDIMRRRIIPLAALLIMALTISAQAIDLRAISVVPSLSFNGKRLFAM